MLKLDFSTHLFLSALASLMLRPSDLDWLTPEAFLNPLLADVKSCKYPILQSCETIPNIVSKRLHLYLCLNHLFICLSNHLSMHLSCMYPSSPIDLLIVSPIQCWEAIVLWYVVPSVVTVLASWIQHWHTEKGASYSGTFLPLSFPLCYFLMSRRSILMSCS